MIVALSACAGGGGSGGGDALGGNIPVSDDPQYADDGTKLADAPDGTEFPLLQTQGYYANGGGKITGEPGARKASITPLADGMRLKVENFMDVEFRDGSHRTVKNGVVTYTKNVSGREVVLQLYGVLAGLDYMELGAWAISNGGPTDLEVGIGVGVGGYETRPSDMPTSGTATYTGKMVGVAVDSTGDAYDLLGNAAMTADFGSGNVSGNFTGTTATNVETLASSPWNDVNFGGTIAAGSNDFSGTTSVGGANTNPGGLADDASGVVGGKFFGPGADEAGGAWTLEDSSGNVATGAFGVTQ
ncbi:transferrin-binding protein-like solute binding protein [Rhodospirillaceae bacterium SYSU D60014]|uniref:transferrin-binding protein-like solute binding protein n=1 Tax=Virgifigura deserti TaxID=2268457 RepID=UPI0013C4831C